ncbi:hypothetical protein [Flavobacterium sp.]|uniref:hypothetical protein n=1 Tax=Flavobacterium sp. TaxID=239 RepID=UPI003751564E
MLLIIISLISVKFYYLYITNLSAAYSNEIAYNNGDSSHYLKIGKNISDFNVYSDTNSKINSESATWRPPFWPFILSVLFKFTNNPLVLIVLKSILEVFIIGLILFRFKNEANLKFIYLLPFLIVFIEPQYLKYSINFLSESLSAILILGLTIFFASLNKTKRYHIAIPIIASMIILCHPVSIFFVISLFIIYLVFILKSNFVVALVHGLLFSILVLAWPYRNYVTFDKGFYLTASQGATFSKGWNEKVATQFTNVDGDLADENLNLKFVDSSLLSQSENSVLAMSKLYTIGTKKFINEIPFQEKINIGLKKLISNFNPFPEKPKPGFLETLSIFFRILYLVTFVQMIFRFFRKEKIDFNCMKDRIYLVVLAVFIGQTVMSVYVYTGLRFNSIYSLTLLFCFVYINNEFLRKSLKKRMPFTIQKRIN